MATYKDIQGSNIPIRSSDPSNPILGEIWYNTTSGTLKGLIYNTAAFATGGTYSENARQVSQATTSATSGLAFAGCNVVPGAGRTTESNKYDGTSWTATPAVPTGTSGVGFGTPTAAILGGDNPGPFDAAYSWNDTSWTTINPMASFNRTNSGAWGTQTAGMIAGGEPGSPSATSSREFDGTCFSAGPNTNVSMAGGGSGGGGASTGAILAGNPSTQFEEFSGTAFTASTAIPTQNAYGFSAGSDQDNFLSMGNLPGGSLLWNGSSWTTSATLNSVRGSGAPNSGGTVTSAIVVGGFTPGTNYNTTEEYTGAGPATVTITSS